MAELERVFQVPVIESYGMTEASHQMASNPLPPLPRKAGSVGLAAGPQVAVMAEDSSVLLLRETVGELVIRGPNVTAGYLNNQEANASSFVDGWFRTGDQGYMDAEGYIFITGRLKELINRGGEKITPREIDEVLLDHPAVAQAVAFSIPDPTLGEDIAAAVVLRDRQVTELQLREFAATRLADFKVPRRIVILDEIPKGPTGKLQRIGLAKQLGLDVPSVPDIVEVPYVAPRTLTEEELAQLWEKVLGRSQISIHQRFRDVGGDSMLAMLLLAQVSQRFQLEISAVSFFDRPTIAEQAALIVGLVEEKSK
jgi:acyl-CoA synthetase (AMP-forming)/AMP-acid ligase II